MFFLPDPVIALIAAVMAAALIHRFAGKAFPHRDDAECHVGGGWAPALAGAGAAAPREPFRGLAITECKGRSSTGADTTMTKAVGFRNAVRKAGLSAAVAAAALGLLLSSAARAQGGFDGPGLYEITNVKSGKLLDLDRNDQTSVIQFSSRGTDNQVWEVRAAGAGFYSLHNQMNGNALEARGTRNSTPVEATRFSGGSNQHWRFDAAKDGAAHIVSRLGKTLDIAGGSTQDGVAVQTYEANGNANQQFKFRLVSGARAGGPAGNTSPGPEAAPRPTELGDGRTPLKPGWNMFSAEQDVELGQQAAIEAERQVPLLNDARVDNYLNSIGRRLAAHTPGHKFPYAYKAVNDRAINAFALPGGRMYINRGTIEASTTESQLAGVMAHEAAHVALRHGTNQASKASVAQMPLAILGGVLGGSSTAAALTQLGAGFTVNSILLKYSRDAESQADLLGTQILHDAGYDPRGMAQFFETLQAQDRGANRVAFFNSHPNPDRRVQNVMEEAARLGASPSQSSGSSREFDQVKRYVQGLAAPRANQLQGSRQDPNAVDPASGATDGFLTFENSVLSIDHPESWRAYGQADAVTIAPGGGMVDDGQGNQAMAYGVLVNIYEPHADHRYGQQLQGPGFGQGSGIPAAEATDQLIQDLRQSNQNLRVVRRHEAIDVSGQRGLSTYLSNDSPMQGVRETNWLITLPHPEGLLFLVFTAPEREFQRYENAFQRMLYSVRVKQ